MGKIKEKAGAKGQWKFTYRDQSGKITRIKEYDNLLTDAWLGAILNNSVASSPTHALKIIKFALGSNTTAPAISDVKLGTETYRNNVASLTSSGKVLYATGFFSATEFDGTIKEVGLFAGAATADADTGLLVNHAAVDETKSDTESLTIDVTITLADA
jgi:hypothetical protein